MRQKMSASSALGVKLTRIEADVVSLGKCACVQQSRSLPGARIVVDAHVTQVTAEACLEEPARRCRVSASQRQTLPTYSSRTRPQEQYSSVSWEPWGAPM